MEDLQKNILVSIMNINTKLNNLDSTYVDDTNALLSNTLTEDDLKNVNETISTKILNIIEKNWTFAITTLPLTNLTDKKFLTVMAQNTNALNNVDVVDVSTYITTFLTQDYSTLTPTQEYSLYNMIVKMSIFTNNSDIIKTVIDKIQSL